MKLSAIFFIIGLSLAPVGIVAIIKDQPYTGTFSFTIPPGQYYYLRLHIFNGGLLSGDFTENRTQLVSFHVFDQQQFDSYQLNGVSTSLFSRSDVPGGTYTTSITYPGTYYLVTTHGTGYDQTSEQLTVNVRVDSTNLPYLGLESLAPISVGLLVVAYSLRKREDRRLVSSLVTANPNFGPGQGEDDDRILGMVRDLCRELGLGFEPLTLYWAVWLKLRGIRQVPSDQCLLGVKGQTRGYVYLPVALRGRLGQSEWKPLIASSLIYSFHPELRRKRLFARRLWLSMLAAVIAVPAIFLWIFNFVFPVENSAERFLLDQLPLIVIVVGTPLVIFTARKLNIILRKYYLEADAIAATTTGRDQMVQTLKKIDSMRLADIEERKREKPTIWRRAGVLPWPSITMRIRALETTSTE